MPEVDGNAGVSLVGKKIAGSKKGVWGDSNNGYGVVGTSDSSFGVWGLSGNGKAGVYGQGDKNTGVSGEGALYGVTGVGGVIGVDAYSDDTAIAATSYTGYGIFASGGNIGVYAEYNGPPLTTANYLPAAYLGTQSVAGDFYNDIYVHGMITKFGGGFKIDDPRDPANKFLSHSFVESSDMKNIYDGVAVLDSGGKAEIGLPGWFDEINGDFRYQLTPIGSAGPNLHVAEEVSENRFKIAGGSSGMKVSWQVTGIRKDPWANSNRIKVEEEKPSKERGYYLNPELFNESSDKNMRWARYPDQKQRLEKIKQLMKRKKNKITVQKGIKKRNNKKRQRIA